MNHNLFFYYMRTQMGLKKKESQRLFSSSVVYDIHIIGAWNCRKFDTSFLCVSVVLLFENYPTKIEHYRKTFFILTIERFLILEMWKIYSFSLNFIEKCVCVCVCVWVTEYASHPFKALPHTASFFIFIQLTCSVFINVYACAVLCCVCVCGYDFLHSILSSQEKMTNITVIKYRKECILAWMRININLEMNSEA